MNFVLPGTTLDTGPAVGSGAGEAGRAAPSKATCSVLNLDLPQAEQNWSASSNGRPQFGQNFADPAVGPSVSTAARIIAPLADGRVCDGCGREVLKWGVAGVTERFSVR